MPQTKILQIVDNLVKQADNADTLDGKHASEFASASDVETLKTQVGDTSVSEQIDTALKGNQADWNQNDETAADYVKNRTHYVKSMTKSTMVDGTFAFAQYQDVIYVGMQPDFTETFKDGQEYIVTFDDTEFDCIAYTVNSIVAVGNAAIAGLECGNNEPFAMYVDNNSLLIATLSTDSSHIVKIEHVTSSDIKKLDQKYIPDVFLSKNNPTGAGSFSLNRKADTTIGDWSFAEGYDTEASGDYSHAEGGYTEASGDYSHAEGGYTEASGDRSHAEGDHTTASGMNSHAEGGYTEASGDRSHAEGDHTTASGMNSHAEGTYTIASGQCSHAEGNYTTASGPRSHAEGRETTASGTDSHAEGTYTIASSDYQHVQGKYNIEDSADVYADIIGNGTSNNKSNASTLDWLGNAWFAGDVYTGSTSGTNKDSGSKKLATEEYVSTQISAIPTPDVSGQISTHNSDSSAHSDIRTSVSNLSDLVGDTAVSTQITNAIANKVDKVDGKGLSTNDYTTDEKTKLSGIDDGANKTIVDAKLDTESTNPVQNKAITNWLADNVKNYKLTRFGGGRSAYVDLSSEGVSTLAAAPEGSTVYAIGDYEIGCRWGSILDTPTSMKNPNALTVGNKTYDGSSAVTITASDLSAATETYVNNKFTTLVGDTAVSTQISTAINAIDYPVDSVNGKTGTVNLTAEDVGALPSSTQIPSIDGLATETYVDTKVAGIVDSAPEALNTLKELADALGNDNNFATTVATEIGKKVDKIEGKGLSTNDYTTAEKTKLSGIEEGANKTVIDSALSSTSTNPVQNKVVNTAISNLNTLVGDTSVAEQINTAVSNKAQVQILTWEATD